MELVEVYRQMARARAFERAVHALWSEGRITGEMHAGTGEEGIAACVVAHLQERDALALTHRCSPFLVARGVPLVPLLHELLGSERGLSRGRGGHMHVFSREQRVATSGIVGASLPMGAGFALAARRLRPGAIAVAQTGDGAMNQGMALETLNLAVAWRLPLLVVCIDNGWAIATPAGLVTAGDLEARARAFGWEVRGVDGTDLEATYEAAGTLIGRLREGRRPAFLLATSPRMNGHYHGDMLVRLARRPMTDGRKTLGAVMEGAVATGGGLRSRASGLTRMMGVLRQVRATPGEGSRQDPLVLARKQLVLAGHDVSGIARDAESEVRTAVRAALGGRDG